MKSQVNASRRRLLKTGALAAAVLGLPRFRVYATGAGAVDPVLATSTVQVAKMLRNGEISAVELVRKCYERIDAVNPLINAVVATCRERALAEAADADAMLAAGKPKGALHGVPFTVKDSFDTAGVVTHRRHARAQGLRARRRRHRGRARARGRRHLARQDQHAGIHARRRRQRYREPRLRAHQEPVRSRTINRAAPRAAPARSSRQPGPSSTSARTTAARFAAPHLRTASQASSPRSVECREPATSSATAAHSIRSRRPARWHGASRIWRC